MSSHSDQIHDSGEAAWSTTDGRPNLVADDESDSCQSRPRLTQLDVRRVGAEILEEIESSTPCSSALILTLEGPILSAVASFGVSCSSLIVTYDDEVQDLVGRGFHVARRTDLPRTLSSMLNGEDRWLIAPLSLDGITTGMILVGLDGDMSTEDWLPSVSHIVYHAALSLESARTFRILREHLLEVERRRVAQELHDGVAQALTHIRLELDFVAMRGAPNPEALGEEAARLARIAHRALLEVRTMITGLGASVSEAGLVASLQEYLRDLKGLIHKDIEFYSTGTGRVQAEIEPEIFRIAQEAVANALRHSGATLIEVTVDINDGCLHLIVEDDGHGIGPNVTDGVGLTGMRERARQIDASLIISPGASRGTRVELHVGRIAGDERLCRGAAR